MATDLSQITTALIDACPAIVEDAANAMGRDVQLSAPVGETGDLSRDWEVQTSADSSGASATLTFTTEYASYQEEGTGPHQIDGNPLLAFNWNGQTVIVHSVHHPGSTKNVGWFSNKAEDESLWTLLCQAAADSTVIS